MSAKDNGGWAGKKKYLGRRLRGCSLKQAFIEQRKDPRLLTLKLRRSKKMAQALKKTEARNKALVEAVPGGLFLFNLDGVCLEFQSPDEQQLRAMCRARPGEVELTGKKLQVIFNPAAADALLMGVKNVLRQKELQVVEFSSDSANQKKHFEARLVPSGKEEVLALVREVTVTFSDENYLKHLSLHDQKTGLYNRVYFEDELERLEGGREYPVAVMLADLDGLQLINEAFGYEKGDQHLRAAALILKESVRCSDIIARMGGDEFALILPFTNNRDGKQLMARIKRQMEDYNRKYSSFPLSMATGIAFSQGKIKPLKDAYREAERLMYEDKQKYSINRCNEIVQTILSSFFFRHKKTEGFIEKRQELTIKLGRKAGLNEKQLADLKLLAKVYDLGKVTVSEDILNKQGKLTEAEWEKVRQHVEKGYRIASSSSELAAVAELILLHHENYDGSGYPLGLKGDAIPVECRIIAVIDAYMAMIKGRPYGRLLTVKDAISELDYCSGWQFDPRLIPLLASVV